MSSLALKQYIEKELQAKRFLQEGLDLVTEIEGLEAEKKALVASVAKFREDEVRAAKESGVKLSELRAATDDIRAAKATNAELIADADKKALAITTAARVEAVSLVEAAKFEAASIKERTGNAQNDLALLLKKVESAQKDLADLEAEKERVLKKFGHKHG